MKSPLSTRVLLAACLLAPASCRTGPQPVKQRTQCGTDDGSAFAYATRDANRGSHGLIDTRLREADAHLLPGAVCSIASAIGALTLQNRSLHCTASLISPRVALTAAHCVHRVDVSQLRLVIGDDAASTKSPSYQVQRAIVHPQYLKGCESNDLAAVVLEEDVVDVQPLELASAPLGGPPASPFTYVGYGFSRRGNASGAGLKRCADLRVQQVWSGSFLAPLGTENVCHGDSGGPALERTEKGYRIVGVTSWGDSDCRHQVVSTDVGASFDWLGKVSSDAEGLRPVLRAALAQTVVEMIDPSEGGAGSIMNDLEPFPGFPYYSTVSDNNSTWPNRAWTDRQEFGEKVKRYFADHPFKAEGSVTLYSSSPRAPDDPWPAVAAKYMELRTLANFELKRDASLLSKKIGKPAAESFVALEKARTYLKNNLPNRLWILRVRNESRAEEGPLDLSFLIGGSFYDLTASTVGTTHAQTPTGLVTVHVPKILPRDTAEIRVWYRYLETSARVMPDLSNVKLDKTQGVLIKQLVVEGARLVPTARLVEDETKVAYHTYTDLEL